MFRHVIGHSISRYLFVGGVAFVIDFGLLALLKSAGVTTWLAATIAFLVSFVFSYVFQRKISFQSQTPHGRAFVKYVALVAVNTAATAIIVTLLTTSVIGWEGGKIVATAVTSIWNYFLYRHWIFHQVPVPARLRTLK